MAKTVVTMLTDDLDGSEADETVTFAFRGTSYEIDLTDKHAGDFEKALGRYVDVARRVAATRTARPVPRRSGASSAGDVRSWARDNGYEVSERGRVSAEVREAYEAAH